MGKLYQLLRNDDPDLTGTFECECGVKIPIPAQPEEGDYVCCFGCGNSYVFSEINDWQEIDAEDI